MYRSRKVDVPTQGERLVSRCPLKQDCVSPQSTPGCCAGEGSSLRPCLFICGQGKFNVPGTTLNQGEAGVGGEVTQLSHPHSFREHLRSPPKLLEPQSLSQSLLWWGSRQWGMLMGGSPAPEKCVLTKTGALKCIGCVYLFLEGREHRKLVSMGQHHMFPEWVGQ